VCHAELMESFLLLVEPRLTKTSQATMHGILSSKVTRESGLSIHMHTCVDAHRSNRKTKCNAKCEYTQVCLVIPVALPK
jgi:hypothetical protein